MSAPRRRSFNRPGTVPNQTASQNGSRGSAPPIGNCPSDTKLFAKASGLRGVLANVMYGQEADLRGPVSDCQSLTRSLILRLVSLRSGTDVQQVVHQWRSVANATTLSPQQANTVWILCDQCNQEGESLLAELTALLNQLRQAIDLHRVAKQRAVFVKAGLKLPPAIQFQEGLIDDLTRRLEAQHQAVEALLATEWVLRKHLLQIHALAELKRSLLAGRSNSLPATWSNSLETKSIQVLPSLDYVLDKLPQELTLLPVGEW